MSNEELRGYMPIFGLFRSNIVNLQTLRPDIYLIPDNSAYRYGGELGQNLDDDAYRNNIMGNDFEKVMSVNTSIIFNCCAMFEGFLENILIRKIGKIDSQKEPLKTILNKYKNEVIFASSTENLNKYFKELFGIAIKDTIIDVEAWLFLQNFYPIRHLLVHGSMAAIKIEHKKSLGTKIKLVGKNYEFLNRYIQKNYKSNVELEVFQLLLMSPVIDDFFNSTMVICKQIKEYLINNGEINENQFYSDNLVTTSHSDFT